MTNLNKDFPTDWGDSLIPTIKIDTKARKDDSGKVRLELLSVPALNAIAEVMSFGAKKYTKYKDCTCPVKSVTLLKSKLEDYAKTIMINGLKSKILTISNDKEKIMQNGLRQIESDWPNITMSEIKTLLEPIKTERILEVNSVFIISQLKNLQNCLPEIAISAAEINDLQLTIATIQEKFVDDCAINVILALVGLCKQLGLLKHLDTCESHQILREGAHNWRQGFNWSRLYGAALRHLTAHLDGEDKDPESGLSHLAHLGCCVMFLLEHEAKGLGKDDRYVHPRVLEKKDETK